MSFTKISAPLSAALNSQQIYTGRPLKGHLTHWPTFHLPEEKKKRWGTACFPLSFLQPPKLVYQPKQSLAPNVYLNHFPNVHHLLDSPQWLLRKTNDQVPISQWMLNLTWTVISESLYIWPYKQAIHCPDIILQKYLCSKDLFELSNILLSEIRLPLLNKVFHSIFQSSYIIIQNSRSKYFTQAHWKLKRTATKQSHSIILGEPKCLLQNKALDFEEGISLYTWLSQANSVSMHLLVPICFTAYFMCIIFLKLRSVSFGILKIRAVHGIYKNKD